MGRGIVCSESVGLMIRTAPATFSLFVPLSLFVPPLSRWGQSRPPALQWGLSSQRLEDQRQYSDRWLALLTQFSAYPSFANLSWAMLLSPVWGFRWCHAVCRCSTYRRSVVPLDADRNGTPKHTHTEFSRDKYSFEVYSSCQPCLMRSRSSSAILFTLSNLCRGP